MSHWPVLYIGVAAPLLEEAQVWRTTVPQGGAFPRSKIGAYGFSRPEPEQIQFFTGRGPARSLVTVVEITATTGWMRLPGFLFSNPLSCRGASEVHAPKKVPAETCDWR